MAFDIIKSTHGGRRAATTGVMIGNYAYASMGGRTQAKILFGHDVVDRMKLSKGDRLDLFWGTGADHGTILLRRGTTYRLQQASKATKTLYMQSFPLGSILGTSFAAVPATLGEMSSPDTIYINIPVSVMPSELAAA
jgi:hypothetical protein